MRYRKLDANGDYVFGAGSAEILTNTPDAVAQAVLTRLRLWKGEWYLNVNDGTPWLQDVLGKYTKTVYDMLLRQRILQTPGVNAIQSYSSTFDGDTRTLSITTTIDTLYGPITVQATP